MPLLAKLPCPQKAHDTLRFFFSSESAVSRGARPLVRARPIVDPSDDQEKDIRYKRVDFSAEFALEFRRMFLANVGRGPAGVNLALAALQVAGEDDALATNSPVKLPIDSFMERLEVMAEELAYHTLPRTGLAKGEAPSTSGGQERQLPRVPRDTSPDLVLGAVAAYLREEKGFRTRHGRSMIPAGAVVDNPGVWEQASTAYLHEVLTRRVASPAAMAILQQDILQRLLKARSRGGRRGLAAAAC